MKSCCRPAVAFVAMALSWVIPAVAQSTATSTPSQKDRVEEICGYFSPSTYTLTGSQISSELTGLTNYYRAKALDCLLPKQSFVLDSSDAAAIVGKNSTPQYRASWICRLSELLPINTSAAGIVEILDNLQAYHRSRAIGCLAAQIETNFSVIDVIEIAGPLIPENDPAWTLMDYDYQYHQAAVCALAENITTEINAQQAADLLSLSRNYQRYKLLECFSKRIALGLSWDDVELILGTSTDYLGGMIDLLGEKTPDGRNTVVLKQFHQRFSTRKFLVDPDPPNWLLGQCVAWARLAYAEVSETPFTVQVGSARNIPQRGAAAGYELELDPRKARVGAMAVWDDGGAGHVAIITEVRRNQADGLVDSITVSEANWGTATMSASTRWGIGLETAEREFVTDQYGRFAYEYFQTSQLDRPPPKSNAPLSYKFIGYILP